MIKKDDYGGIAVLCDFDGTIVDVDTGALILERFGKGDWRGYDAQLESGSITLEECLIRQFRTVNASRDEILKMIRSEKIDLRRNFSDFLSYCRTRGLRFIIVTGGIDFCIHEILSSKGLSEKTFQYYCGKSECSKKSIEIVFPKLANNRSLNFKQDLVNQYHGSGKKVAYIGDGISDYEPSKEADLVFAVKGSSLARMCRTNKLEYIEFSDFAQVMNALDDWIGDFFKPHI